MNTSKHTELDFAADIDFSEILTNPILDIAARFWSEERYEAFRVCYRSMRVVDDLVDDRKAAGPPLTEEERRSFAAAIERWTAALAAGEPIDRFQEQLMTTMDRFAIPRWPWEKLSRAMIYDLYNDSFPTFHVFLRYTEGAAISPASVFMHLCGVTREDDRFRAPDFDIRRAARPLAVFSYLVHILRDFEKDLKRGLNYFAGNIMRDEGVKLDLLQQAAQGNVTQPVRDLVARYARITEYYRRSARVTLDRILPLLAPRYRLSLETIYTLYLQIYERVNPERSDFSTATMNPSPTEVQARIGTTIEQFRDD